ncbi:conserved hypothetical protein [Halomicrobium mukohataei DSM 12286]|uniref:Uncharacterized protein n=2 Tax=Halomicrobium mukohataei TaxID=57705 RepID=C7P492_HALMD|nr:conserved hypothetical protein [Halomicrobium mukohataei DSM 12286]
MIFDTGTGVYKSLASVGPPMDRSLDIEHVARELPDLDAVLDDTRLRPIGLVGGFALVLIGALLGLPLANTFWTSVVSGVLVFVGIPLFSVGLAAPEPDDGWEIFTLGVDLTREQRRIVGIGSLLVVFSPITVALLGPILGFATAVWLAAAALAVLGSVLILTGFIAWTSRKLVESPVSR